MIRKQVCVCVCYVRKIGNKFSILMYIYIYNISILATFTHIIPLEKTPWQRGDSNLRCRLSVNSLALLKYRFKYLRK